MKPLARTLRQGQTDAERHLWKHLRNRRLAGFKFRRQEVIGPYIVDFACFEPKLVIEADGGQHVDQTGQDVERTRYLESLGYMVVRFWNHQILSETDSVLELIRRLLINPPHPNPLPEGEGNETRGCANPRLPSGEE